MAVTKLKACPQELWLGNKGYSSDGICYYMSEYVREKVWSKDVKTFKAAVDVAKEVVPKTIVSAGLARNLQARGGDRIAQDQYDDVPANLAANKVYRVGLWFGKANKWPADGDAQNHEAVVITGAGSEVVFFEPNFGFYHADDDNATLKDIFESAVDGLYQNESHALNFHYQVDRSIA